MKICLVIVFYFVTQIIFSQTESMDIRVGIATPFVYQATTETLIIKSNLVFELYSSNQTDNILFSMIDLDEKKLWNYQTNAIQAAEDGDCDYLFLFETYSAIQYIFIQARLLDVTNSTLIFSKTYRLFLDVKINDALTSVSEDLMKNLLASDLKPNSTNVITKPEKNQEEEEEKVVQNDIFFTFKNYLKHEFFIMNGFLKTTPEIFTIFSFYTGYNYYPNDFFFVEAGIMGGMGKFDDGFSFSSIGFQDMFAGTFVGLHFYIRGMIEPNIGARVELIYQSNNSLLLSIPFDIGFKIFISRNHVFRVSSSFPINTFNIFDNVWDKKFTLGFMVGYGFKI